MTDHESKEEKHVPYWKYELMDDVEFARLKKMTNFLRVYYARKNGIRDIDPSWVDWYLSVLVNLNGSVDLNEHALINNYVKVNGLEGKVNYFENVIKNNVWQPDNYQNTFRDILGKECPYPKESSYVTSRPVKPEAS